MTSRTSQLEHPVWKRMSVACVMALCMVPAIGLTGALPQAGDWSHTALREAQAGLSLDAAVARAQNRFRAKAVKADVREEGGRRVYFIRLLNREGRVWTVRVDAQTGGMD